MKLDARSKAPAWTLAVLAAAFFAWCGSDSRTTSPATEAPTASRARASTQSVSLAAARSSTDDASPRVALGASTTPLEGDVQRAPGEAAASTPSSIVGHLYDETHAPLAARAVAATRPHADFGWRLPLVGARAITNDAGFFELRDLSPGEWHLELESRPSQVLRAIAKVVVPEAGAAVVDMIVPGARRLVLILESEEEDVGFPVELRRIDAERTLVAHAVARGSRSSFWDWFDAPEPEPLVFDLLEPALYELRVHAFLERDPHAPSLAWPVDLRAGDQTLREVVDLRRFRRAQAANDPVAQPGAIAADAERASLSGTVLLASGLPLAGAPLAWLPTRLPSVVRKPARTTTDDMGRFVFAGADADLAWLAHVQDARCFGVVRIAKTGAPPRAPMHIELGEGRRADIALELPPELVAEGWLRLEVVAQHEPDEPLAAAWFLDPRHLEDGVRAKVALRGLPPLLCFLRVLAPGLDGAPRAFEWPLDLRAGDGLAKHELTVEDLR